MNIGPSSRHCAMYSTFIKILQDRPLCQPKSEFLATFTKTTKPFFVTSWLRVWTIQWRISNVLQVKIFLQQIKQAQLPIHTWTCNNKCSTWKHSTKAWKRCWQHANPLTGQHHCNLWSCRYLMTMG